MRIFITHVATAIIFCATLAAAIPPPRLPLHKPIHEEPNLLTDYERKTLKIELANLTTEITTARRKAAKDPSLETAYQTLRDAQEKKDPDQISSARRNLADKIETLLFAQEGMSEKVKRLLDVGRLLEYDTQYQKDDRRRKGTRRKQLRLQNQ